MNSCLYECSVMHARLSPRRHAFRYQIFLFAIDLDEIATPSRWPACFAVNRRNVYSFREADYLPVDEQMFDGRSAAAPVAPAPARGLKQRVIAYAARQGVELEGGRVVLVTLPRVFGYLFNPVSFYFCTDRQGRPVATIVEVTNTFREMKPYFLAGDARAGTTGEFQWRAPKHFYVSPYSDVDVAFDFALRFPGEGLSVQIDDYAGGQLTLTSRLSGARRALTSARLGVVHGKISAPHAADHHADSLACPAAVGEARAVVCQGRARLRAARIVSAASFSPATGCRMSSTSTTSSSFTAAGLPRPTQSLYRRAVLGALWAMNRGYLRVDLPDGAICEQGTATGGALLPGISARAQLRIRREAFFKKCFWSGDIGFAEAYIDGDWDTPDLTAVVAFFIHNLEHTPTVSGSRRERRTFFNALRVVNRLGHLARSNTRTMARRNIREHYDLSNEFFALWLDPSLMYSGALWPADQPQLSLEEAQREKNDALCRHLRLQPRDHVLEIGTGWGGWSLHAARHYGCRITTVTISQEQFELARRRIAEAGLAGKVDVQLRDFREITGHYDKIVSIEMIEALGHRYQPAFAEVVSRVLKPDGLLALQFITCPDARYGAFRGGVDFIQKHIFPGSLLLSINRVSTLLAEAGGFMLHRMNDLGPDYARTLRLWRERFQERLPQVRALGFDERFIRKWTYYLCYCEAAFALRNISVVHTVHTRPNNLTL